MTLADIRLDPNTSIIREVDSAANGFVDGLEGSYHVDDQILNTGEIRWLDRPKEKGAGMLRVTAADKGARLVSDAGRRQHEPIVPHGPFVGDTNEDIVRAYQNYRAGHRGHLRALR